MTRGKWTKLEDLTEEVLGEALVGKYLGDDKRKKSVRDESTMSSPLKDLERDTALLLGLQQNCSLNYPPVSPIEMAHQKFLRMPVFQGGIFVSAHSLLMKI